MPALGGPPELVDAVQAAGRRAGPVTKWAGAWNSHGRVGADWDAFFRDAAARGRPALVFLWWFGDEISRAAIRDGVDDSRHRGPDGKPVRKTVDGAVKLAQAVAAKAHQAGAWLHVCVEQEFNKADLRAEAGRSEEFAAYWRRIEVVLRAAAPDCRIIFAPGAWGDLRVLATHYRDLVARSDAVGIQAMYAEGAMSAADVRAAAADVERDLAAIRDGAPGKPAILYDLAISTYGGAAASRQHPYAGGTGSARDAEQLAALRDLAARVRRLGVEAVVYRSLRDDPSFDLSNHFGHAERHWGVVRADGSRKPAYPALLALADEVEAPAYTETQYRAVHDRLQDAERRLAAVRDAAGPPPAAS